MTFILKLDRLAVKLLPIAITLLTFSLLVGHSLDPDTWLHLANGRWMVSNTAVLHADPFSYTRPGAAWAHPGYPYEVLLYLVVHQFGEIGADILASAVLAATFLILWKVLPALPQRKIFLIGVAMLVSFSYWSARPNQLALLFSVITVALLEQFKSGSKRSLWALPLVVLLWANLHGSFILAFFFLGMYSLDYLTDRPRIISIIVVGFFMALATLATPYGLGVYHEMITTSAHTAEWSFIMERQSPNFHQSYGIIALMVAMITVGLMGLRTKSLGWTRLLFPIALIALAFYSANNVAMFGVLLPFVWNSLLPAQEISSGRITRPQPWFTGLALGLLLFSLAYCFTGISTNYSANHTTQAISMMPVKTAEYLRNFKPPGPLYNNYGSGGYLIWALASQYPVFIDSRSDIYGDEIINQSLTIDNAQPGWKALVETWKFNIIITAPTSALSDALRTYPGWQQCFREPGYLLFLKVTACPNNGALDAGS
jgi:hypothetical protein